MHPRRHWPGSAPRQSATLALAPWASSLRRRRATNSDSQGPTLQAIRRIVEVVDPVLTDVQGDAHRSRAIFESINAIRTVRTGRAAGRAGQRLLTGSSYSISRPGSVTGSG